MDPFLAGHRSERGESQPPLRGWTLMGERGLPTRPPGPGSGLKNQFPSSPNHSLSFKSLPGLSNHGLGLSNQCPSSQSTPRSLKSPGSQIMVWAVKSASQLSNHSPGYQIILWTSNLPHAILIWCQFVPRALNHSPSSQIAPRGLKSWYGLSNHCLGCQIKPRVLKSLPALSNDSLRSQIMVWALKPFPELSSHAPSSQIIPQALKS